MADDLAVSASGALVHGIDELGAELDVPSQELVLGTGSDLVELGDVVDLSPGGDGLPRCLVVGLAHVDAVTALETCCDLFLDTRQFYHDDYLLEQAVAGPPFFILL